MSTEDYPIIDTTDLDLLVSSYAQIVSQVNPMELLDVTKSGLTVEEELLGTIKEEGLKLSGGAILASAQFAIGLDNLDQIEPSIAVSNGACGFAGRVKDILVCDFTDALASADILAGEGGKVMLPGVIFETDSSLDSFASSLGIVSLAPYCAVLPGSPYELRRIPFSV